MNTPIEKFEVMGMEVAIWPDSDPLNPRTEWDNFGRMLCFHKRYNLGDKTSLKENQFGSWDEVEEYLKKEEGAVVILPLCLLDHSGITMYVGNGAHRCDPGGWDSGRVGFIYATKEKILKEFGKKRLSKSLLEKVEKVLRSEVKVYDQYLTGDVYIYVARDRFGEIVDSCCGFFGIEEARTAGEEGAKCHASKVQEKNESVMVEGE